MVAVQAIYSGAVATGTASFELDPPDLPEMLRRRQAIVAAGLPYLVACDGGRLLGYAYAGPYRPRPAYRFMVENSVYIAEEARGRGIGSLLMAALIAECARLGYRQMIAVIGDSGNAGSIALHRRHGFRPVGVIEAAGFKFGRWIDSVLMQRPLGAGAASVPENEPLRSPAP